MEERQRFLDELDGFFERSGMLEICARCHAQGTGCCPSGCRRLTSTGCRQKTVWCGAFVCSAMLGALRECSPETSRMLTLLKDEVGPGEWRLFELVSRTPGDERDEERHVTVSAEFPELSGLGNAEAIRPKLLDLAEEILELRRAQHCSEHPNLATK